MILTGKFHLLRVMKLNLLSGPLHFAVQHPDHLDRVPPRRARAKARLQQGKKQEVSTA